MTELLLKLVGVVICSFFGMMILVSTYGEIGEPNKNGFEEWLTIFVVWCIIWALLRIKNSMKQIER